MYFPSGDGVSKITPLGIQSVVAGGSRGFDGDGGPADQAILGAVAGLAYDAKRDALYVSDIDNQAIRKVLHRLAFEVGAEIAEDLPDVVKQYEAFKVGESVRIYLVNILEYDVLNSFHMHANFFQYYSTGTSLTPSEYTDTIMQVQGQRGVVEFTYPYKGLYMFHAHKTEFAELGWTGVFEVENSLAVAR